MIPLKNEGARLSLLSKVDPLVTCTPGLLGRLLISSMGLGVVVTTARGRRPSLRAKERLSQVSCAYSHDASSSHQAASNWGPLSWSGSWLENTRACAPLGQVSFSLGWFVGGLIPGRRDIDDAGLALDHDGLCFGQGAGDEGRCGLRGGLRPERGPTRHLCESFRSLGQRELARCPQSPSGGSCESRA